MSFSERVKLLKKEKQLNGISVQLLDFLFCRDWRPQSFAKGNDFIPRNAQQVRRTQ